MIKSVLKYSLCAGLLLSTEVLATFDVSQFQQSLAPQSQCELSFLQMMIAFFRKLPGEDEMKASAIVQSSKAIEEMMASAIDKKMEEQRERIEWINRENEKIIRIWKSLEEWDEIYNAMENPAYAIAGRSRDDENNPEFFSNICRKWENIFRAKSGNREQISEILKIDGFSYSLAIMLINAEKLFQGKWKPLENLSMAAYGERFCDFSNPQAMKEKGMAIMESIRNYNLAYVYLGDEEE
jgi:hypothetical protein